MNKQLLTIELEKTAKNVAKLYLKEVDEVKKEQLEKVFYSILKMRDEVDSKDENFLNSIWKEILSQSVKLGLKEIFEQLSEINFH